MDLIAANDQILVRGIGNSFLTYGETESGLNARLIAAAPDLLDALRWIIRELPTSRNWLDPDCERACKAAIAKAEGKA
jgi:hypothetical protein